MTYRVQYVAGSVNAGQLCQLWSTHIDALERHLSAKKWALTTVTVVMIAYPIARIVIPAILNDIAAHVIVPNVLRTVLKLV